MDLGKGFSVPQEKAMSENPRQNNAPFGMQNNQVVESENWQELIGLYTNFLQDETCNVLPVKFNPNSHIRDVAPSMSYNGPIHDSSSTGFMGLNQTENNVETFLNQNTTSVGSNMQKAGKYVPPRKVNSFAELMGETITRNVPSGNGDSSNGSLVGPGIIDPTYQVESNSRSYRSDGVIGGCNLQQIPNRLHHTSTAGRRFQLAPVTPDQRKHLNKDYQTIQMPTLLIDEISAQVNERQENVVLTQQPEIVDRDHNNFLNNNTPTDGGINLSKTPQQKAPKRSKLRPKVIVEGKLKRTPKPKNNTPDGNSTQKRKHECKNGVQTSKDQSPEGTSTRKRKNERINGAKTSIDQSTDAANEAEMSEFETQAKSCRRALNFDLENEIEHNCYSSEVTLNLNLDSRNAEWSPELDGQSRKEQRPEGLYNSIHSEKDVSPQESLSASSKTSKDHGLNDITRCLNVRNAKVSQSDVQITCDQVDHSISKGLPLYNGNGNSSSMATATPVEDCSGRVDKNIMSSVDYIPDLSKALGIDNNVKEIVEEDVDSLVPYREDGAVVSYEPFDSIKKRHARPKVDLDPETSRLWDLLMCKEGSENAEKMENDKQKWWEDEREVFRGRVDSFIARMHLVQGDRRFSKWKGSVVDSVIGVFLTQNVSDHLSSSAFMSLAAKFPIKSTTVNESSGQNEGSSSLEQAVTITYPDGTSYEHRTLKEQVYNHISVTSSKLFDCGLEHVTSGQKILTYNHQGKTEEGMIASQSSSESSTFQASKDIRFNSGSNSEAEDQITGNNFSKNQYQFQVMEDPFSDKRRETSISHQQSANLKTSTGLEEWEADFLAFSGNESTSSLASIVFNISNGKAIERAHDKAGPSEVSILTAQKIERPVFQTSRMNHETENKHLEQKTDIPARSRSRDGQNVINFRQGGVQETFQQENTSLRDPIRPSEESSVDLPSSKNGTSPNVRKRKAEKTKAEPFNWDALRKQVESKDGTRGRSRDCMDSLDYEALRNADVSEISDAIKERGMNNMLAERIKDFLNRLVTEHGGMDLEWLRDVQPDKAKDYLLSIRGLGLKSVECIRLLTLHHLAFPVDTNVGRIAVRLGWVPLQPLPESLQLHLLELYPMLDSVQKYLWPRLCKLDQETLYELHYQMITFGKVFCTKRDPNCNACPLRGECRHFASAFASARLALPGPEERGNRSADVIIKPMPLLPPGDDNLDRGMEFMRNCEPIIEEPKTPESPIEFLERDIEDAFYEDPDEIPEIKLNIDEFTTNLQSFIQENIEMQEDDMSKALVALGPAFASIPAPKLKHVSRLRTEHLVYELPDSHMLLNGMDRREPDDPSPYLLAIWTPGETVDSVQPPESNCSTSEAPAQTVRGTILVPCRTAMRGSFPLNGTYFQVNEVFADHESSINPIDVPRSSLWNLPRRTVYFGTSVSTICRGLSTEDIQYSFWKGFVCVRGFDRKTRGPKPLMARLHLPASKMSKKNEKVK